MEMEFGRRPDRIWRCICGIEASGPELPVLRGELCGGFEVAFLDGSAAVMLLVTVDVVVGIGGISSCCDCGLC